MRCSSASTKERLEVDAEALVHDYLGRLDAAAGSLPPSRRAELAGEVRQHIEMALAEAGGRDEVTVRNVLDRLGPPDEIVDAERGAEGPAPGWTISSSAGAGRSGWGGTEIAAILLLTLGAIFLPFIGPLLGLIFVWASTQWTTRHKLIASAIVVVLVILPIILVLGVGAGSAVTSGQLQPTP
jgi:HAAS domain-containing protein